MPYTKPMEVLMKFRIYTLFALLVWCAGTASSQTAFESLYVTNGRVDAVVVSGNTIYIGGMFTSVGPNTGAGVAIGISTGTFDPAFPRVDGIIYVVIPDGSGGWYIGGSFTAVGGITRNNIAHILSNKSLDPIWNPNANSTVYALALSGSTVYAGGEFATIGGETRNRIAALDASTGSATSWNPNANGHALAEVRALAISGPTVYVGGRFTSIGGAARNNIAALDAATGLATIWNPNANSFVFELAISGSTVYAGGNFSSIGGQTRNRIAALDASTGLAASWNPNSGGDVWALAISGSTVYAGGYFSSIGGQTRSNIAALDASTGSATSWNPNANGIVWALALDRARGRVYAGGLFTSVLNKAHGNLVGLTNPDDIALPVEKVGLAPRVFSLSQNYPNPFNPSTKIRFTVPSSQLTVLKVYNVLGQEIATLVNEVMKPGHYEFTWDATGLPSGVYFYRMTVGSVPSTKAMILMK